MSDYREFWQQFSADDHRALGHWAAACAEHVLPLFERNRPQDGRPRHAIETLREWVATGRFGMAVVRGASLGAHAAARDCAEDDDAARFAARAAGQAMATAHVPAHALGAALYATKAVAADRARDAEAAAAEERAWQDALVPERLRGWMESVWKEKQRLLPQRLREAAQAVGRH